MIFLEHFFKPISILHKRKKYTEKEIVVISRKKRIFLDVIYNFVLI